MNSYMYMKMSLMLKLSKFQEFFQLNSNFIMYYLLRIYGIEE
jgi:hypothetical protein